MGNSSTEKWRNSMKELSIINRLQCHRDVFKNGSGSYQDMQDAINCIIGLKAENEALRQRLELLAEMEKKDEID